jgi:protein gp37
MGQKVWGSKAPRRFFRDSHWEEPLAWNEQAHEIGVRERVFCASMADVFEKRSELDAQREKLWILIEATPNLDWLLLTKRPQNIGKMVPWTEIWPANVWLGTTVENQELAENRIPFLLSLPAAVRFLSCEPLLGPIDLSRWTGRSNAFSIDWVIAGGESGPKARPMHPDWASDLLRQCQRSAIAFHFKQWGHWIPAEMLDDWNGKRVAMEEVGTKHRVKMAAVGKKHAGRILEGSTWDGLPNRKGLVGAGS